MRACAQAQDAVRSHMETRGRACFVSTKQIRETRGSRDSSTHVDTGAVGVYAITGSPMAIASTRAFAEKKSGQGNKEKVE